MPGPQGLLPGVVLAQLPPTGTPTPQTHVTANFGLTHCPDEDLIISHYCGISY